MRELELFRDGAVYHVYNRGVDKRNLFADDADRQRFIKGLIVFNEVGRKSQRSLAAIDDPIPSDRPCVDVVAYCLMPNHYHLMLRQISTGGISEFMHRIGVGYTNYFNKRHDRRGSLLETAYKIKRSKNLVQQRHLSRYIHLNPLELIGLEWKKRKVDWKKAESFLLSYAWSSFRHFVGAETQSFVRPEMAMRGVGNAEDYVRFLGSWIERDWKKIAAFDQIRAA